MSSFALEPAIEITSKFILCVLLTQLGKTFTAIERICTEINNDNDSGRSIHIIFTMNTLLSNKQFAKRLERIEKTYGEGSVCVFASKYTGKYKHVKNRLELQGLCVDESICPRVVVMCSNIVRYDDGVEFIKVINKNKIYISRTFVYCDELHKYITDSLRSQIEEIHNLDIVKGIIALTASPDRIWQESGFWSKIRLIQLDDFSDANYVGHKDMIFNCIDDFFDNPYIRPSPFDYDELDRQTIGFIDNVLKKYPEILGNNTRSFIPGHIRRQSHERIRNLIFSINANTVVIVINGFEKTLQYNDCYGKRKTISLTSEDEEVCETISRVIMHHELQNRPIVITGLLCVSMGQTLTHNSIGSFTSAILGHLDLTNDEIYQLFGRITGRMKHWGDKYTQTQVYCPTKTMHICITMEECARHMARDHNGEVVTQEDYREPMNEMGEIGKSAMENIRVRNKPSVKKPSDEEDWELISDEFTSIDEANKLLKNNGCNRKLKFEYNDNGFILSSTSKSARVLYYNDVKKEIDSWSKKSGFDLKKKSEKASRMIIAYKDIKDKESIVYIVRIIKRKDRKIEI
tara:strand:+ start:760 stop:2481 length:1722 start_codon:yes stop_codon:yes gene_type:complete